MPYQPNEDGTVTISATLQPIEWDGFLLAWGQFMAAAESQDPPALWMLVSIMNRLMEGNTHYAPYEIPDDRTQPFTGRYVKVIELPDRPKQ